MSNPKQKIAALLSAKEKDKGMSSFVAPKSFEKVYKTHERPLYSLLKKKLKKTAY